AKISFVFAGIVNYLAALTFGSKKRKEFAAKKTKNPAILKKCIQPTHANFFQGAGLLPSMGFSLDRPFIWFYLAPNYDSYVTGRYV
ncbi:MAG: hypothetical protein ABW189_07875, partial [Rickettsiales bacterium]